MVRVELDPLSPGEISLLVMTPSINTLATPLTVATRTTRMKSRGMPPVRRKRICSGDCLSMLKTSWKPLWPTSSVLTSTSERESSTTRGTVSGTTGPIINVS